MKKLHKIIALFAFIFFAGIFVTIITLNTSLNKSVHSSETTDIQKDTLYLLQAEKKAV
ncbi:hypothetical protein [uncultured Polaribacter sp.]|uniref:hypothetical protein n=1 Tax=uncultured Polaribacter sp. TaxID=174711 RepID=UPI0026198A9C|nr:hypothetical protein [uncultured Polaribacter sp.]